MPITHGNCVVNEEMGMVNEMRLEGKYKYTKWWTAQNGDQKGSNE